MPALNANIRKWAAKYGALALPFGLANIPEVTAGIVQMADRVCKMAIRNGLFHIDRDGPPEFYCAVSTGVMIRALQIGWPRSKAIGIAVARNMKDGEIGDAHVTSYHKSFNVKADVQPPFESTAQYDAKAYDTFIKNSIPGSIFINVGKDKSIWEDHLRAITKYPNVQSNREWGDYSDFKRP